MKFGCNQSSSLRRSRLKLWTDDGRTDGQTDDGACLYYKLPEAFGSGELKMLNTFP